MLESHHRAQRKVLRIFQANVGCGQTNHNLVLALARPNNADIILLQETWLLKGPEKHITKKHPNFENFNSTYCWDTRPSVLIYARKGRDLRLEQLRPAYTAEISWIKINDMNPYVKITNIYSPP